MSFLDRFKSLFGKSAPTEPRISVADLYASELGGDGTGANADAETAKPSAPVEPAQVPRFRERRGNRRSTVPEGTRILIVDDSPTLVALLRKMLDQNQYETIAAADAESALAAAFDDPPDLIFLDIVLPGMSGFEALRRLRRDPRTKEVPVIMISGNEQAVEQFYAQRIGADDFMKKPFARSEVFSRIENLRDEAGFLHRRTSGRIGQTVEPTPGSD